MLILSDAHREHQRPMLFEPDVLAVECASRHYALTGHPYPVVLVDKDISDVKFVTVLIIEQTSQINLLEHC